MEQILASDIELVSRVSATGIYDFIIVGSGIGGGILAEEKRTLPRAMSWCTEPPKPPSRPPKARSRTLEARCTALEDDRMSGVSGRRP